MTPREAYDLALEQGPSDETRRVACQEPWRAYEYARDVDKCGREDTRAAACQDPLEAYSYARDVDRCARDDTRAAACLDTWWTHYYVTFVDECLYPVTLQALPSVLSARARELFEFD